MYTFLSPDVHFMLFQTGFVQTQNLEGYEIFGLNTFDMWRFYVGANWATEAIVKNK